MSDVRINGRVYRLVPALDNVDLGAPSGPGDVRRGDRTYQRIENGKPAGSMRLQIEIDSLQAKVHAEIRGCPKEDAEVMLLAMAQTLKRLGGRNVVGGLVEVKDGRSN